MSFSARTGFNPVMVLGWIRSEVAEGYRRARWPELAYDPWLGSDPWMATGWQYVTAAIPD